MKLKSDTQQRYSPEAGTHDSQEKIYCGVCGDVMDARFGLNGPTGSIEAMAGRKHLHDSYTCPNTKELWHDQVVSLREEKHKTPSAVIEELLEREVQMVLEHREPTKNRWFGQHVFSKEDQSKFDKTMGRT